jgi:hypothetical protein
MLHLVPLACARCHAVRTANDLHGDEDELSFPPEFTERFFGEEGKIYGYKGLKVFSPLLLLRCYSDFA